ncbi:uncharacterized protein BcabD6B2_55900 [Babesia caballi]|uniref:Uncharacterized protein n=1 Tax=Babesia caballi TaxID=5871 RepID=A0AAV4M297_BABCB|nr:hypothetical protein BcabD6B2_55900 [Babesia caballi]
MLSARNARTAHFVLGEIADDEADGDARLLRGALGLRELGGVAGGGEEDGAVEGHVDDVAVGLALTGAAAPSA